MRFPQNPSSPRVLSRAVHRSSLLLPLAVVLFTGVIARGGTLYLSRMSGANENPPTTSTATGTGALILNAAENGSIIIATHTLGATVTAGHVHRGAANVNGPVIFPFPSAASPMGPFTWTMSSSAVDSLKAGELYMNFHTAANPGGAIRGQLVRAVLAPAATDAALARLAGALDISAGFSADLDQVLIQTNLANVTAQTQALRELSASTVYSAGRQQLESMAGMASGLFAHADDVRLNPSAAPGKFNAFVRGGSEFGRRSSTANQTGATISRPFVTAGVDRWFSADSHGGIAVGYVDGRDSFENNLGRTNVKTAMLHGFASANLGALSVDGIAGYGWSKIESVRNLASLNRTANASPDGSTWAAALRVSKAFTRANHSVLTPYALIDVQKATVDAYSETGAGDAGLVVSSRETWSSALEGGVALRMPFDSDGGRWTLRAQAGWRYLLEDGAARFGARLIGSPVAFFAEFDGASRSSAHVEAALDGQISDSVRLSFGYRGHLGASSQTVHAVEARLVWQL